MRVFRAIFGNDAVKDDINGFFNREFRSFDVIGKIGLKKSQVCVRRRLHWPNGSWDGRNGSQLSKELYE